MSRLVCGQYTVDGCNTRIATNLHGTEAIDITIVVAEDGAAAATGESELATMGITGFLCLSGLTILLLGLTLGDGLMTTMGFLLLVVGMYIVVIDDD